MEIVTDSSVTIPPGSPPSYGMATVSAHAANVGQTSNIAAYERNAVYGADVYIKNLTAFGGDSDAKTITYATDDDVRQALTTAQATLSAQEHKQKCLALG